MPLSVLILTYNESINIGDCLRSVTWCDDVVILDSFSTDDTGDIARSFGARVFQRRFDDYASQRNYGLSEIQYQHPWVLMLDADERVPTDLRDELRQAVAQAPTNVSLFRLRRRDHLYGRWIPRSSGYPTWFGRVARLGRVRVERACNEEFQTPDHTLSLRNHLDHYSFNKGFHEWILKHDRYSTMEAQILASEGGTRWRWRDLMNRDPVFRRKAQKGLIYSLPGRPLLVFLALYFFRGGMLEGRAGFTFCALRGWYEFMIDCKCREIKRRAIGLEV